MTFGPPELLASLLGVRPGMNVSIRNAPAGFLDALGPLPDVALVETSRTGIDLTVLFAQQKLALVDHLTRAVTHMSATGFIWVVFPLVETPIAPSEDFVRLAGFELGLEDTRRLLLGEAWVALRLQRRKGAPRLEKPQAQA
ncbi:MAG: DUF3052 family protein [Myxococcaceae bacterium]|nr:DUF3052 family protein [Myxococcaceae bacterium]